MLGERRDRNDVRASAWASIHGQVAHVRLQPAGAVRRRRERSAVREARQRRLGDGRNDGRLCARRRSLTSLALGRLDFYLVHAVALPISSRLQFLLRCLGGLALPPLPLRDGARRSSAVLEGVLDGGRRQVSVLVARRPDQSDGAEVRRRRRPTQQVEVARFAGYRVDAAGGRDDRRQRRYVRVLRRRRPRRLLVNLDLDFGRQGRGDRHVVVAALWRGGTGRHGARHHRRLRDPHQALLRRLLLDDAAVAAAGLHSQPSRVAAHRAIALSALGAVACEGPNSISNCFDCLGGSELTRNRARAGSASRRQWVVVMSSRNVQKVRVRLLVRLVVLRLARRIVEHFLQRIQHRLAVSEHAVGQ